MAQIRSTPLAAAHQGLGARMTAFAGFEMPLSYRSIIEEHLAVRSAAGIFDLSHMGELMVEGSGALALLERALTNSAARLHDGAAQYSLLCAEDGGTIDDLVVYRIDSARYMLCVNAANTSADLELLRELKRGDTELRDASDETALVAVQGPGALSILQKATKTRLDDIPRFGFRACELNATRTLAARTGYTGEDGFELFVHADSGQKLFETMLQIGESEGLKPCGLGARDTLRMEAGLPLYGHELDRTSTPLEAGLSKFVKLGRGFVGEGALQSELEQGLRKRLVGIRTDDAKSIARQGHKLFRDGNEIGVVTSGTYAPSFKRPLAMAYVRGDIAMTAGDRLEVEIRGRMVAATIVPLPFYRRQVNRRGTTDIKTWG